MIYTHTYIDHTKLHAIKRLYSTVFSDEILIRYMFSCFLNRNLHKILFLDNPCFSYLRLD